MKLIDEPESLLGEGKRNIACVRHTPEGPAFLLRQTFRRIQQFQEFVPVMHIVYRSSWIHRVKVERSFLLLINVTDVAGVPAAHSGGARAAHVVDDAPPPCPGPCAFRSNSWISAGDMLRVRHQMEASRAAWPGAFSIRRRQSDIWAIDRASKTERSEISAWKIRRIRAVSCIASTECPPKAKKSSWMLTLGAFSISDQRPIKASSTGFRAKPLLPAVSRRAPQSTLPSGSNGRLSIWWRSKSGAAAITEAANARSSASCRLAPRRPTACAARRPTLAPSPAGATTQKRTSGWAVSAAWSCRRSRSRPIVSPSCDRPNHSTPPSIMRLPQYPVFTQCSCASAAIGDVTLPPSSRADGNLQADQISPGTPTGAGRPARVLTLSFEWASSAGTNSRSSLTGRRMTLRQPPPKARSVWTIGTFG